MSGARPPWRILGGVGLLAGLGACGGDDTPPMPTTTKTVPVVEQRYQHRDLAAWRALGAEASAEERAAQAWAMATLETEPERSADVLVRLLQDPDASVRLAAVVAAGRLAPPSAALARALVPLLDAPQEPIRRHARAAAGRLGAPAVPLLREALGAEALRLRWGATAALAHVGPAGRAAVPDVDRLARDDPSPIVRRQARLTLARLGPEGAAACAAFLRSDELAARSEAAAALGAAGADAVPALEALLQDPNEVAAALAAGVLADLGPAAASAVPALVRALARPGPVRIHAAEALAAVGEPARVPVEALREAADSDLARVVSMILERLDEAARPPGGPR